MMAAFVALVGAASIACADTLDAVRAGGVLRCGANGASEDYTRLDTHGDLTDLADEICKAVAVAVLGVKARTEMHEWPDEHHMLTSLRDKTSDLAIGAAPTIVTATAFDVGFAPPVFYDGQGILARNGIGSLAGLADKQICFVDDASLGENLRFAMQARGIPYKPFPFEEVGEMLAAAGSGRCAAITGNVSQLVNLRVGLASIEKQFQLLPTMLTKDPVAPAFRADDRRWAIIVTAVVTMLIQADESGVTAANAEQMKGSGDPLIQQLVGARGAGIGHVMGLPNDWALAVLKAVGNYGEIYDRTLGADSDYKLPRGANQPWSRGGVMYALPLY
jgi:general L-amino acid transport system substrate-binding protein